MERLRRIECASLYVHAVRSVLLSQIVKLNRERDYKIGTGFLTTPFVFECLSEAGESDDAYRMLVNPEFGWVQQINNGATIDGRCSQCYADVNMESIFDIKGKKNK